MVLGGGNALFCAAGTPGERASSVSVLERAPETENRSQSALQLFDPSFGKLSDAETAIQAGRWFRMVVSDVDGYWGT